MSYHHDSLGAASYQVKDFAAKLSGPGALLSAGPNAGSGGTASVTGGVPTVVIVGALGLAAFLAYRVLHKKKSGTTSAPATKAITIKEIP